MDHDSSYGQGIPVLTNYEESINSFETAIEISTICEHSVCRSTRKVDNICYSDKKIDDRVPETIITIREDEIVDAKDNHYSEIDKDWVCRICLSNSPSESPISSPAMAISTSNRLMQLGCQCKDEIGLVHVHCANEWFKSRRNSQCEICGGDIAKSFTEHLLKDLVKGDHGDGARSVAYRDATSDGDASSFTEFLEDPRTRILIRVLCLVLLMSFFYIIILFIHIISLLY